MAMSIVEAPRPVTGGIDTHLDAHVAAVVDVNGGVLGVESFPTTTAGFVELHDWLVGFGEMERVGVEGTGAYGAGLARHLRGCGLEVIEVDRPNRQARRRAGKSDPVDAIEAARAVLAGRATGIAKTGDGPIEAMRSLLIAKRSGREARITCLNQLRHLGFCGPDDLREAFRGVPRTAPATRAAGLRPRAGSVRKTPPPSTQPGREPSSQPCAVADRVHPPGIRSPHPHLRRAPSQPRTLQARDHPRAQTLRRPRGLPAPPAHLRSGAAGLAPQLPDADRLALGRSAGP